MYKITKNIILDVNRNAMQDIIYIPQGTATAHQLAMHINQNGHSLDLTGCSVQIKAVKPDDAEILSFQYRTVLFFGKYFSFKVHANRIRWVGRSKLSNLFNKI